MHDYLDYNRSRQQIDTAREAGRKRQQKGREKQADGRSGSQTESQPNLDRTSPETHLNLGSASGDPQNESRFQGSTAGQEGPSRRDTLQGPTVVPSQPLPSPPSLSSKEKELASHAGETGGIPEFLQPLADALHHAGLIGLGWDLKGDEAFRIQALIKAKGIPAMTQRALTAAGHSTQPVGHVRYFLGRAGSGGPWLELPTVTAGTTPPALRAVAGGWQPFQNPTDPHAYDGDL